MIKPIIEIRDRDSGQRLMVTDSQPNPDLSLTDRLEMLRLFSLRNRTELIQLALQTLMQ